jgi:aryl-alcohol dehydrogenase-like predicted oxidoreductase
MRLSTERDRDEAAAIDVLHAAFDAGITLLDTADAYCWDDDERGHNERLIARALAAREGVHRKRDVAAFLPTTQFRYQRELEPPDVAEGFVRLDLVPFERRMDSTYVNRADPPSPARSGCMHLRW